MQTSANKKDRKWQKMIALGICIFVLSSCSLVGKISEYNLPEISDNKEKQSESKQAVPDSAFKKTEIALIASTFNKLNPYAPQDASIDTILKLCYQSLMVMMADGKMTAQLADEVILSEDTKSCRINLGEKEFHDGSKVTWRDVQYSWQKAIVSKYSDMVKPIQKISSAGENQVEIDFTNAGILNLNSLCFPIVRENSLEKEPANSINGTGFYRLEEYKPMQTLRLKSEANTLEITLSRTEEVLRDAFLHGLTDIYFTEEFPWLSFSEETLKNIHKFRSNYFYYLGFHSSWSEKLYREFLWNKLDKNLLIKNSFLNHLVPCTLPLPNGPEWEKSETELMPEKIAEGNLIETNPLPIGQKLRIIFPKRDKSMELLAKTMVEEWQSYVLVEAVGLAELEYTQAMASGEFDVYISKIPISPYPEMDDFIGSSGKYNYSKLNGFDSMIQAMMTAPNESDLQKNYQNLAKEIRESKWIMPLGFTENAIILNNKVEGPIAPKTYDFLSGIGEVKVAEPMKK